MKKPLTIKHSLLSVLLMACFIPGAFAAVSEIGFEDFSPETVVINFDNYPNGSGPIPGFTVSGTGDAGVGSGSGWGSSNPGRKTLELMGPIELIFDSRVTRVGFVFGGNTPNQVPFEVRRNGVATGSYTLTNLDGPADGITNFYFLGYEDPDGIDSIWFDMEQVEDWVFGIYDLSLDDSPISSATSAVPTLSSYAILIFVLVVGLAGAFHVKRRIDTQNIL